MKKLSSISSKASNKDSIFIPPQPPKSLFGGVSSIKSNKSLNGLKNSLYINSNNKFISEDSSQSSTIKINNNKCNYLKLIIINVIILFFLFILILIKIILIVIFLLRII